MAGQSSAPRDTTPAETEPEASRDTSASTSSARLAAPPPTPVTPSPPDSQHQLSAAAMARSMLTPPPSAGQSELTARLDSFTMGSPSAAKREFAPANMPSPPLQGQSFFAQNRAIPLSGLPLSPRRHRTEELADDPSIKREPGSDEGLPPRKLRALPGRNLTPLVTKVAGGQGAALASPRVVSPCVYVRAVGLRRGSSVSSRSAFSETDGSPQDVSVGNTAERPLSDEQVSILAVVRPAAEQKPYTIQRVFDRKRLSQALPHPDPRSPAVDIIPSPVCFAQPAWPSNDAPSPVLRSRRRSSLALQSPAAPYPNTRRHSRGIGQKEASPIPQSPAHFVARGGTAPIPMVPHSAMGHLPGLAAVILSGRVKEGDVIEQPLPCPEAWPETLSYAYGAQHDITDAVRRNIEHLGGIVC